MTRLDAQITQAHPTFPPAAAAATTGISIPPKPPTALMKARKEAARRTTKETLITLKIMFMCVSLFIEVIMRPIAYTVNKRMHLSYIDLL